MPPSRVPALVAFIYVLALPAVGLGQFGVWKDAVLDPMQAESIGSDQMAIDDDTQVVAVAGSAHVYVQSGGAWDLQATLAVATSSSSVVAIGGDTILVSDLGNSVQVFARSGTTWSHEQTLTPSIPASQYGSAIAIDGDTAVVSAGGFEGWRDEQQCAVYVYLRTDDGGTAVWNEDAVFFGTDPWGENGYGASVAMDDDTVVVGEATPYGYSQGKAHVYVRDASAWIEQAVLTANEPHPTWPGNGFGESVAISEDTIVVAASWDFTTEVFPDYAPGWGDFPLSGAAHFFVRHGSTWTHKAKLFPEYELGETPYDPEPTAYGPKSRFGRRVAINGDVAIVTGHRNAPTLVFIRIVRPPGCASSVAAARGNAGLGAMLLLVLGTRHLRRRYGRRLRA